MTQLGIYFGVLGIYTLFDFGVLKDYLFGDPGLSIDKDSSVDMSSYRSMAKLEKKLDKFDALERLANERYRRIALADLNDEEYKRDVLDRLNKEKDKKVVKEPVKVEVKNKKEETKETNYLQQKDNWLSK